MDNGSRVLALDELPYLVESEPAFPGLLQAAWDARLSRTSLKIIVCGSSISMMESLFLSRQGPLFGRRTGQLQLGPLPAECLREAFAWQPAELIELAATFGGIPGYLARLDSALDLASNLEQRVLARGEPLYEEIPFLLREELREPHVYQALLSAIAAGATRFGELSSKVGLDRANLSRYLATLAELGLVQREVPITERAPEKSRKGRYRIADPFVSTWYAFVHPYRDRLERGRSKEVLEEEVRPRLRAWLGRAVEPVLVELLSRSRFVDFDVAFHGRYWSPTVELDLVLLDRERRRAVIGEVKWGRRRVARAAIEDLRTRAARAPELRDLDITYTLVSRAGFSGTRDSRPDERFIEPRMLLDAPSPG
jgi:AAA+ ATPase superfamily predicted ATPase